VRICGASASVLIRTRLRPAVRSIAMAAVQIAWEERINGANNVV
jgi:hypothetical protein